MSLRTAMPSAPYDLSSWKICLVATPFAFHTIHVSTVVAAHWMSPEAIARWRSFCGIFLIETSRPFFLKMPASRASVRGAKPVHPLIPMATAVWAEAVKAAPASAAATRNRMALRMEPPGEKLHHSEVKLAMAPLTPARWDDFETVF